MTDIKSAEADTVILRSCIQEKTNQSTSMTDIKPVRAETVVIKTMTIGKSYRVY